MALLGGGFSLDTNNKWPIFFPDGCPPENAVPQEILVYRCAIHKPHTEKDFIPYNQMFGRDWGGKLFESCGLSCFTSLNDAINLQSKMKKFKCVVSGTITKDTGVVMNTPSNGNTHITWWVYKDIQAHKLFKVHDGGENNEQ